MFEKYIVTVYSIYLLYIYAHNNVLQVIDKVYSEFIRLIHQIDKDRDLPMLLSIISTFSNIGPNIEPQFREEGKFINIIV